MRIFVLFLGILAFQKPIVGGEARTAMSGTPPGKSLEDEGIDFFENRLRQGIGSDFLAHLKLADLYLSRFRITSVWADWKRSRAHLDASFPPGNADALFLARLSALHLAAHDFHAAMETARQAVLIPGADGLEAANLALFDAMLASGRYDEAIRLFQSLAFKRASFPFLTRRAQIHELLGELEEAKRAIRKAREDALAFSYSPSVLAWCSIQLGDMDGRLGNYRWALASYQEALKRYPGHPRAIEGMAGLSRAQGGNPGSVKRLYREALSLGGPLSIYLELMRIARESGDSADAGRWKDSILIASRRDPGSERLHYRTLAQLYGDAPETREEALRYARMDVANRPTAESHDILGWILYQDGRIPDAYHASRMALKWGSRNPGVLYRSALIAWHAGKRDEAEVLLSRTMKILEPSGFARLAGGPFPSRAGRDAGWGGLSSGAREVLMLHSHTH